MNDVSKDLAYILKQKTASSHRTVEKYLTNILFDNNLSRHQYWLVLLAMKSAYRDMEAALKQYCFTRELFMSRSKLAWLDADIDYLKLNGRRPVINRNLHFMQTEPQALGAMYVMEGATLGGSFIFNKLQRHDWLSDEDGIRFFNNYGHERHAMWGKFQLALKQYDLINPKASESVVNGANDAFNLINITVRDTISNDNRL